MHRQVGFVGAVHPEHAQELLVRGRVRAQAHQGQGGRIAGLAHQLAEQLGRLRARVDQAAAAVEDRPLRLGDQFDRLLDGAVVALHLRTVALRLLVLGVGIGAVGELDVLRQVHHHRARAAAARDVERLVHDVGQLLGVLHQVVMLGAGPGDAGGVGLLEGVVADQMRRHLAGQAHDRDRVHQRVGQAGHRVGGAGTRGHQHAADLAGRPGIALGRMHRRLFVAHQNVPDGVLLKDLVVDR